MILKCFAPLIPPAAFALTGGMIYLWRPCEVQTREALIHKDMMALFAGSQKRAYTTNRHPKKNKSDQPLTFNDPFWPMQWELVDERERLCVFVFTGFM